MYHEPLRADACSKRNMHLSAGGDIDPHPFLGRELGHRLAEERFGGVGRAGAKACDRFTTACSQVCLVVDEERGPELGGQLHDVDPADREPAVGIDGGGVR